MRKTGDCDGVVNNGCVFIKSRIQVSVSRLGRCLCDPSAGRLFKGKTFKT